MPLPHGFGAYRRREARVLEGFLKGSGGSVTSLTKGSAPESVPSSVPKSTPCTVTSNESKPDVLPTTDLRSNLAPPSNSDSTKTRFPPWSSPWYAQRLRDQTSPRAVALLRTLAHSHWQAEATEEVLIELNKLSLEDAAGAIQELRGPKCFIHGLGNSLTLNADLMTLDDQRHFVLKALVDSGCTGSSIDAGFVKGKGLNA